MSSPSAPNSPPRRAAALVYDPTDARTGNAPRLVAKGQGLIADEIIKRARAAGVSIHESRELVAALMQLDLDRQIPPALYVAVAEVLAWVYRLEQRASASANASEPGTRSAAAAQEIRRAEASPESNALQGLEPH